MIKIILKYFYWKIYNLIHLTQIESQMVDRKTKLGKKVIIRKNVKVGRNVILKDYSYISGPGTVIENTHIGKFTSIALGNIIGLGEHPLSYISTHPFLYSKKFCFIEKDLFRNDSSKVTKIGNDVWIGAGCIIKKGVKIGDGAVIGAGSVVTKNVDEYAIVAGSPARLIRYRFRESERNKLLKIKWWDWSEKKIKKAIDNFYDLENFLKERKKNV